MDDGAGYEEHPNENSQGQDNYLASSNDPPNEDYQEEIQDQGAYFADGYGEEEEEYYGEEQW